MRVCFLPSTLHANLQYIFGICGRICRDHTGGRSTGFFVCSEFASAITNFAMTKQQHCCKNSFCYDVYDTSTFFLTSRRPLSCGLALPSIPPLRPGRQRCYPARLSPSSEPVPAPTRLGPRSSALHLYTGRDRRSRKFIDSPSEKRKIIADRVLLSFWDYNF